MRTVNVEISVSSLYDIAEKACKAYRKELAEAEFLSDIPFYNDNEVPKELYDD